MTTSSGVTVNVNNVTCTRANPSVLLSPSSQSGIPGTPLNYTFSVTSQDTAGCSSATFNLASTIPAGWTGVFNPTSLTLNPAQAGNSTFTVTSAAGAAPNSYTVTARATNSTDSTKTASANATYTVTAPCTRSNPGVSLSPGSRSGAAGSAQDYTFSVTNNDTACASSTFSLTSTIPAGWSATFNPTSLNLATGATGTSTFRVTSAATATPNNYTFSAKATNSADPGSNASATGNYVVLDTTPPSAPTGLTATVISATRVNLAWNASTDNVGVTGYYINRNGVTIASTAGTSYSDTTVLPSTTYSYNVTAFDAAGNTSGLSNTATVTTPALPDTAPPSAPTNLRATSVAFNQVNLAWNPSTDNVGVAGYNIIRNGVVIVTVGGSTTTFGDGTVSANTIYRYTVTAFDAAGNTSAPSNELAVTTPPLSDTQLPTVTITSPTNGAVVPRRTTITITASATDNVGVNRVEFFVNGTIKCTDTTSPYSCGWQVPAALNKSYTLTAIAYDTSGNQASYSVTVRSSR